MGEFSGDAAYAFLAHEAVGPRPELVADQLGHTLDVNQNVYTQSPVETGLMIVNQLEKSLLIQ